MTKRRQKTTDCFWGVGVGVPKWRKKEELCLESGGSVPQMEMFVLGFVL